MSMPVSGGGPSVPGGSPTIDPTNTPPQTTTTNDTTPPPVPLYQNLSFARTTFDTLGIDLPRAPDDVTSLLAEVSILLEQTGATLRSNRDVGVEERRRTALGEFRDSIGSLQQLNNEILALEAQRDVKIATRDAKIAERNATTDKDKIAALNQQINALNGEIFALDLSIVGKKLEAFFTEIVMLVVFLLTSLFLNKIEAGNTLRDAGVDTAFNQLFDDIAERLQGGAIPPSGELTPPSVLDQEALAAAVERIAQTRGLEITPDQIADVVAALSAGKAVRPTITGVVLDAAIRTLTIDQIRDQDVRGRVVQAAVGLVAGLHDVVTTLGALEALESVSAKEAALDDGLRLRLVV